MSVLLQGGRVIDPASGFDARADVLLDGRTVAAVGADLEVPDGAVVVDVSGLVVGPGFVDLHSHVHSIAGQRLQAMDGVTTALDLEAGLMPLDRGYAEAAAQGRPLHYRLLGFLGRRQGAGAGRNRSRTPTSRRCSGCSATPAGNAVPAGASWPVARPAGGRAGGRGARYRGADGLRAAHRPCRVPRRRRPWPRTPEPRPSPTCASSSRAIRPRRSTAWTRSSSRPPRPVRPCTTATSTAPRAGTSIGCSRRWNASRSAGSTGHRRGLSVRRRKHRHRRLFPGPRPIAGLGYRPAQHRGGGHR